MRKAVFLDRDGVINRALVRDGKPYPPADLASVEILPGVDVATQALHDAGWLLIVVTNQPDVARGTTARAEVDAINHYLQQTLPIDEFRTCYHDSDDHCDCRKPLPGLLLAAAKIHDIDLSASYMVGDRWRDIEAGECAGCKNIFIDYGYAEKQPTIFNFRVHSLLEAARIILGIRA
ncbi:Histidinol phosphatase [Yersinia mollaretii ATCC 43969]|uniref:D,D-heptose 1,7-bisphosphate phosphatase n=1 Tax=Yersinia mollaretii (strain ATCC 43969 / DSM 18520 / CIP 103324 / CNY 7263 / WAIP 204) TaxID=349967 RepID=A0ABM9YER4_YERMW|nr:HAD family hydrolase [Yersinia mollaretii]EEQ12384.1 Histidinol phosphatase [Yersinia mollaretii ATCC 43969]QKJ03478.1 HAD family hydrolase [Yersinia mollaretii ATCC 43969]